MSRLIDIDQVIKDILHQSAHEALVGHPENARGLLYAVGRMKVLPTAYDAEKVLDILESEKEISYKDKYFAYGNGVDFAIEIVKGGGKDE